MNKNQKKSFCLLLTGTIKPSIVYALKRTSSTERENDYFNAISEWMKYKIPIVFCENSNFDSNKIKGLIGPDFEFIQYEEIEELTKKGKGFGEAKIMQYAMNKSKIINSNDFVIKVTGRLFVKNFKSIFKVANSMEYDIMAPLENKLKWSDSRLIIFKKTFYHQYFIKYSEKIDDSTGYCFERALACSIHELLSDNKKWEMLPFYPLFKGFSGTYNEKYTIFKHNALNKIIRFPLIRYLYKF